jgi:Ca2+-binding RTX toxin-like protein
MIVGSDNDEELYGGAGSDFVQGQGGTNLVDAGDGDDFVYAGGGAHEKVFCGSGFDQYRADLDNDLVVGCEQELPGEVG